MQWDVGEHREGGLGGLSENVILQVSLMNDELGNLKAAVEELKGKPPDRLEQFLKILGVLTIAGGLVGVLLEVDRHFQDKAAAREFKITSEVLKLDEQLSGGDTSRKRDAARLLATIGSDSARILIEHLDNPNHEPEVFGAITRGLSEVMATHRQAAEPILQQLLDAARRVERREFSPTKVSPTPGALVAHVQALGELTPRVDRAAAVRAEVEAFLSALGARVSGARFKGAEKIGKAVQTALDQLK